MADNTKIEWCSATWNPVRGCSIVSKGCTNCYAMRQAHRSHGAGGAYEGLTKLTKGGPVWTGEVRTMPELLELPLRWRRPRRIFVNSMSDLFHDGVPEDFIWRVLAIAALCPQHQFQILTKRAARLPQVLPVDERDALSKLCQALGAMLDGTWVWSDGRAFRDRIEKAISATIGIDHDENDEEVMVETTPWPLPNVWLGVSVEDQAEADERIPHLLQTPAAVRWISAEPLLGPVDIRRWTSLPCADCGHRHVHADWSCPDGDELGIDWVVAGGESGPGARPMRAEWAQSLRDQCARAGVPYFFKQWGAWVPYSQMPSGVFVHEVRPHLPVRSEDDPLTFMRVGKKAAGRKLDGRFHDDYPNPGHRG